jgi:iron complex outermembrane recepter protein
MSTKNLTVKRSIMGVAIAAAILAASAVSAQVAASGVVEARQAYNVAGGPLADVLVKLAQVSGAAIIFDPTLVANKVSKGVSGNFTREEALRTVLIGTNLEPSIKSNGTLSVQAATSAPKDLARPGLKAAQSNGNSSGISAQQLPTVTVVGKFTQGFAAQDTSSATRTDTPLDELPQSVQIVSQDVMLSQQVQSVGDVLQNVSGITLDGNSTPYIRGFSASVSANGLQDNLGTMTPTGGIDTPIIGVQQVEVLKGPDSILAGSMQPGGVVNVVLKAPQADPFHQLMLEYGSFGNWLTGIDLTGPIVDGDKELTYRFIASDEQASENFGNYVGLRNFYLAPSIGWHHKGTTLVVSATREAQLIPVAPYTVLVNGKPATSISSPISSKYDQTTLRGNMVSYDLVQELGGTWKFHSKSDYGDATEGNNFYAVIPIQGPLADYAPESSMVKVRGGNTDNNVSGTFYTGPVTNTILIGGSYQWGYSTMNSLLGPSVIAPLSNPNLPSANAASFGAPSMQSNFGKSSSDEFYFQDQMAVGDNFHVVASIARDRAWSEFYDQGKWLPNLGVVYSITNNIAAYVNEMHSFSASAAEPLVTGGLAPPEGGHSAEAGLKLHFLDDKFTGTISAFRTAATNITVFDPAAGGFILDPGNVSRGVEVDIQGRLAPGWNVINSYTYSKYLDVEPGFSQIPRNQGSIWTTYDFQSGFWRGFGIGLGVFARSNYSLTTDTGMAARIPGQGSVNVSAFYRGNGWSATFGVKNIFNHLLYADEAESDQVQFMPGRTEMFTLMYSF